MNSINDIIKYNEGEIELVISVDKETIWLSQSQISELFETSIDNIGLHLKNIYKEKELDENTTTEDSSVVRQEGKRKVKRTIKHYNLDAIICVGYRVSSYKATKFRQWATSILKAYITNGYAINTKKLTEIRLSTLENEVSSIKSHINNNTLEIKQGIFYDGEVFDAHLFISKLIKKAEKSIILIDNYIDESVLTLFSKNIDIKIEMYTNNVSKQLVQDIEKYNKQYKNIELNTIKKVHDRFLIIDKKEFYHLGASLKDLGNKTFAFSKMDIDSFEFLEKIK
jgi:hypothetical protein